VRVAVGVLAEQAEPAFPAGFQVGWAVAAGEPLPCLCLCLEEMPGDCRGALPAGKPPVEGVGVRDLGQQVPERALGSPAVPSAVPSADPLVREDADDGQAAGPVAGCAEQSGVGVPGRQGRSLAGGRHGLQNGKRAQEREGGGACERGEAGHAAECPASGVIAVAPVVSARADLV
jgi:hypothetical protein